MYSIWFITWIIFILSVANGPWLLIIHFFVRCWILRMFIWKVDTFYFFLFLRKQAFSSHSEIDLNQNIWRMAFYFVKEMRVLTIYVSVWKPCQVHPMKNGTVPISWHVFTFVAVLFIVCLSQPLQFFLQCLFCLHFKWYHLLHI